MCVRSTATRQPSYMCAHTPVDARHSTHRARGHGQRWSARARTHTDHNPHTVTGPTRGRGRRGSDNCHHHCTQPPPRVVFACFVLCGVCRVARRGCRYVHYNVQKTTSAKTTTKTENARKQELGLGAGSGRDGHYEGSAMWCVPSPPLTSAARMCVLCLYPETLARVIGPTASNARTRETYLLLQVPQSVLVCAE